MFRKRISVSTQATISPSQKTGVDIHKIIVPAAAKSITGWYRFKVISPKHVLGKIRVDVSEKPSTPVYFFAHVPSPERFVSYLYISPKVATVEFLIDLIAGRSDDLIVDLRPISPIEYVWHSLKRGFLRRPLKSLRHYFRPNDLFVLTFEFPCLSRFTDESDRYQWWIENRETPITQAYLAIGTVSVHDLPKISILMPVCDPQPDDLKKALASVKAQTSSNWQLCIADDASTNPVVRQLLDQAARSDQRVSLVCREQRGGISAATNTAFAQSSSPFVTCLDHDDLLAPAAIEACARHFAGDPACRLLFSDEDKIGFRDDRFGPFFKPRKFSRELFYSHNYITHMTAYQADAIREIGGWRGEYDGAQDYDLNLRIFESAPPNSIHHIPLVLYHWRAIPGSTALDIGYKPYAIEAGRRALLDHLTRCGVKAEVDTVRNAAMYRIRRAIPAPAPKVSILIPFRDRADLLRRCVSSILDKTRYDNFEIILIDNGSEDPATLDLLAHYKLSSSIRIIRDPRPFNYSQLNNAAASQANGEYLCLLNNDVEAINEDWLEDMLSYAMVPDIGCVGAKLYYRNGGVQHAGVVLGIGGVAGHVFLNRTRDDLGYFGRLQLASNFSAVTGACLMVKRSTYMAAGGLDERELPVTFNDIDLCLKIQALGYHNVVTPFAELVHDESATRGGDETANSKSHLRREWATMQKRYGDFLKNDPCYSQHLTLENDDFSLRLD